MNCANCENCERAKESVLRCVYCEENAYDVGYLNGERRGAEKACERIKKDFQAAHRSWLKDKNFCYDANDAWSIGEIYSIINAVAASAVEKAPSTTNPPSKAAGGQAVGTRTSARNTDFGATPDDGKQSLGNREVKDTLTIKKGVRL